MNSQIKGRVWKFGDDINTDIISPGEYMDASYEEIGRHAMERAYPGFADAIEKGDIIAVSYTHLLPWASSLPCWAYWCS